MKISAHGSRQVSGQASSISEGVRFQRDIGIKGLILRCVPKCVDKIEKGMYTESWTRGTAL